MMKWNQGAGCFHLTQEWLAHPGGGGVPVKVYVYFAGMYDVVGWIGFLPHARERECFLVLLFST